MGCGSLSFSINKLRSRFHRPVLKHPDDFEGRWPLVSNDWEFHLADVEKQSGYKFIMERDTPRAASDGKKQFSAFTSLKRLVEFNAW
jgi:hypothetical protein